MRTKAQYAAFAAITILFITCLLAAYHTMVTPIYVYAPSVSAPINERPSSADDILVDSLIKQQDPLGERIVWSNFRQAQAEMTRKHYMSLSDEHSHSFKRRKILQSAPNTYECDFNDFFRLGSSSDGGKWVCAENLKPQTVGDDCVVLSLGSNGQFDFEAAVLKQTKNKCTVHTFDCTGNWKPPSDKIKFHPWCLGSKNFVNSKNQTFKNYDTMIKDLDLGGKVVELFKIDIEGYEWQLMPDMLTKADPKTLPRQISIEIHFSPFGQFSAAPWNKMNDMQRFTRFIQMFDARGYQLLASEYNPWSYDECCQEYTFVRTDFERAD